MVSATVPTAVNLGFLNQSRHFSFKYLLIYPHEAECTPFQTNCYSENLVAPGIEPRTSGCAARNSDHWLQVQKSGFFFIFAV
jgi:hypothetical protein